MSERKGITNINQVVLGGNLTADGELRETKGGTPVLSLRLANNTYAPNEDGGTHANFFDVTVWGNHAKAVADLCKKGTPVTVAGRIEYRPWEDKEGNTRVAYNVTAETLDIHGRRSADSDSDSGSSEPAKPAEEAPKEKIPF
jgi:single-strand DNA-binding protein